MKDVATKFFPQVMKGDIGFCSSGDCVTCRLFDTTRPCMYDNICLLWCEAIHDSDKRSPPSTRAVRTDSVQRKVVP